VFTIQCVPGAEAAGLTRKSRLKPAEIAVRIRPRCAGPAARRVPGGFSPEHALTGGAFMPRSEPYPPARFSGLRLVSPAASAPGTRRARTPISYTDLHNPGHRSQAESFAPPFPVVPGLGRSRSGATPAEGLPAEGSLWYSCRALSVGCIGIRRGCLPHPRNRATLRSLPAQCAGIVLAQTGLPRGTITTKGGM